MKLSYKFILRKRLNADGSQTIIFRINLNSETIPIYTDMKILAHFWDPIKQRIKEGHLLADSFNTDITTMLQNFSSYISECKFAKIDIDKYTIKNFFNNKKEVKPDKDFLAFCKDDLEKYGKTEIRKATLGIYNNCLATLKEFKEPLSFDDITVTFLKDYEKFLTQKNLKINTINKKIKFVRTYINKAIKLGIYEKYVFKNFSIKTQETKHTCISYEEFTKLVDFYYKTDNPLFKKHLQYFLFACCCGLRYSDLQALTWDDIIDNSIYIRMRKTDDFVVIPFNAKIISFLPIIRTEGKIFNLPTNQAGNRILKDIAAAAEIHKKISFHVARHTFASICINLGIPIYCVQKLLGHKKSETTEIYVKLANKTLEAEMQKWN